MMCLPGLLPATGCFFPLELSQEPCSHSGAESTVQLPHSLSVSPAILQYCHPDSTQGFGIRVLTYNGNWRGYISPAPSWGQETGGSRAGSIVCLKDAFLPCKMLIARILVIQHRLGMHESSL